MERENRGTEWKKRKEILINCKLIHLCEETTANDYLLKDIWLNRTNNISQIHFRFSVIQLFTCEENFLISWLFLFSPLFRFSLQFGDSSDLIETNGRIGHMATQEHGFAEIDMVNSFASCTRTVNNYDIDRLDENEFSHRKYFIRWELFNRNECARPRSPAVHNSTRAAQSVAAQIFIP